MSDRPCFARAGIGLNAETDDGYYPQGRSMHILRARRGLQHCRLLLGGRKAGEDVHDGIRELQFDAVSTSPELDPAGRLHGIYEERALRLLYRNVAYRPPAYGNTQRGEIITSTVVNGETL